jgi:SulP family sulfate permease
MSEVVAVESDTDLLDRDVDDLAPAAGADRRDQRDLLPEGVAAFRVSGPLFFAVANRLDDVLNQFPRAPRVFVLRLRQVPLIDASGATALEQFLERCARQGTRVILTATPPQPRAVIEAMGLDRHRALLAQVDDFDAALARARDYLAMLPA